MHCILLLVLTHHEFKDAVWRVGYVALYLLREEKMQNQTAWLQFSSPLKDKC